MGPYIIYYSKLATHIRKITSSLRKFIVKGDITQDPARPRSSDTKILEWFSMQNSNCNRHVVVVVSACCCCCLLLAIAIWIRWMRVSQAKADEAALILNAPYTALILSVCSHRSASLGQNGWLCWPMEMRNKSLKEMEVTNCKVEKVRQIIIIFVLFFLFWEKNVLDFRMKFSSSIIIVFESRLCLQ